MVQLLGSMAWRNLEASLSRTSLAIIALNSSGVCHHWREHDDRFFPVERSGLVKYDFAQ